MIINVHEGVRNASKELACNPSTTTRKGKNQKMGAPPILKGKKWLKGQKDGTIISLRG